MTQTNFLRECKDITINLGNENQKDFMMDLLMQAVFNNFEYEYNGEKLNIVDLNDDSSNGIHIILQKAVKKIPQPKLLVKEKKTTGKKRGRKPGQKAKNYSGNVIIAGTMPEAKRRRYNLSVDEKFENINKIAEYLGMNLGTIKIWATKGWIKLEK